MGGNNPPRVLTEQKGKQQRLERAASEAEMPESRASNGKDEDSRGQHLLMPAPRTESSPAPDPHPHRRPGEGGVAVTAREARGPRPATRCLPPATSRCAEPPGTSPASALGERLCAIHPRHPPRLPPSLPPYIPPYLPPSLLPPCPPPPPQRTLAGRAPPPREGRCPQTPTLSPAPRSNTPARPRRSEEDGDGEVTGR